MRGFRVAAWALLGVALVGLALAYFYRPEPKLVTTNSNAPSFGGPFTLVDGEGQPFSSARLDGKPYAIFFGFTHCPDTCPTTLARLVKLRREAGADGKLNIVFVTVDPERDGPKDMAAYSQAFGAPIIGLTGSPEQIDKVKKQFGIYSEKVPTADGDYTVDHTATVLLFDRAGKFVATISPDEQDPPALAKLKRIIAS